MWSMDKRSEEPLYRDMRRGVSRVEVVVVVALVGVVLSILPAGMERAREASRRGQCMEHIRQIGTAISSYHDANRVLPPAAIWTGDGMDLERFFSDPRPIGITRSNWVGFLWPHLGGLHLNDSFDWSASIVDPRNLQARTTQVPGMTCPSDSANRLDNPYRIEIRGSGPVEFARGNYAINGGSQFFGASLNNLSNPRPDRSHFEVDAVSGQFRFWGNGIAGINRSFSFDEFENGLSTTIGIDEIRAGITQFDPRGVWSLGQIGGSITWGHGATGDARSPNSRRRHADDIVGGEKLNKLIGAERLNEIGMPCCDHCFDNQQATARSQHMGGVNVLTLDGAVHFVSDSVDRGLWDVMHSRETPAEMIDNDIDALCGRYCPAEAVRADLSSTPRATQAVAVGRSGNEFVNTLDIRFVLIPQGEFIMGLPNEGEDCPAPKESPPHAIRITREFYLGKFEVTQGQYSRVMGANPSKHLSTALDNEALDRTDTASYPVEQVSWFNAVEFCRRISEIPREQAAGHRYRLPSEAEWEYACRAGKTTPNRLIVDWIEGDNSGEIANKRSFFDLSTVPVGSYPANGFGLHDMRGNVWEWCADWYGYDYYSRSPTNNPLGPARGFLRVVRGSDWAFLGGECYAQIPTGPWRTSPFIGFRVVCEVE